MRKCSKWECIANFGTSSQQQDLNQFDDNLVPFGSVVSIFLAFIQHHHLLRHHRHGRHQHHNFHINHHYQKDNLVGGFNPFEKY